MFSNNINCNTQQCSQRTHARNMPNASTNTTIGAQQTLQNLKRKAMSLYSAYEDLSARYPTLRYGDRILLSLTLLPIISLSAMGAACLGLLSIFAIAVIGAIQTFIIFVGLCVLLPFLGVAATATLFSVIILSGIRSVLASIKNAMAWMKQHLVWWQYDSSRSAHGNMWQEIWDRMSLTSSTGTEDDSINTAVLD